MFRKKKDKPNPYPLENNIKHFLIAASDGTANW